MNCLEDNAFSSWFPVLTATFLKPSLLQSSYETDPPQHPCLRHAQSTAKQPATMKQFTGSICSVRPFAKKAFTAPSLQRTRMAHTRSAQVRKRWCWQSIFHGIWKQTEDMFACKHSAHRAWQKHCWHSRFHASWKQTADMFSCIHLKMQSKLFGLSLLVISMQEFSHKDSNKSNLSNQFKYQIETPNKKTQFWFCSIPSLATYYHLVSPEYCSIILTFWCVYV